MLYKNLITAALMWSPNETALSDEWVAIAAARPRLTKLWFFLDDEREPPTTDDRLWAIFRNGEAMLEAVTYFGLPAGISFDHDLGDGLMTGHDVAKQLLEMFLDERLVVPPDFRIVIHSANPIGEKNIIDTMADIIALKYRSH